MIRHGAFYLFERHLDPILALDVHRRLRAGESRTRTDLAVFLKGRLHFDLGKQGHQKGRHHQYQIPIIEPHALSVLSV